MTRSIQDVFQAFDSIDSEFDTICKRMQALEDRMERAESGYHGHTFAREPIRRARKLPFPKTLREIGLLPTNERYTS